MARLFWFTVEFGLIREDGQIKVYGCGLISSHGDAANALGPKCDRRPFSLDAVFNQAFEIDHFQDVLFVTESFDQLYEAVEEAGRRIGTIRRIGVGKGPLRVASRSSTRELDPARDQGIECRRIENGNGLRVPSIHRLVELCQQLESTSDIRQNTRRRSLGQGVRATRPLRSRRSTSASHRESVRSFARRSSVSVARRGPHPGESAAHCTAVG